MLYDICFQNPVGIDFGNWVDRVLAHQVFTDLQPSDNIHHDRCFLEHRLEIKTIRATQKRPPLVPDSELLNNTFTQRALISLPDDYVRGVDRDGVRYDLSSTAFHQIKPNEFDVFLGFVVFRDTIRVYVVPSSDISTDVTNHDKKLRLGKQHGNNAEGDLNIRSITEYLAFDINDPIGTIKKRNLIDFI